MFDDEELKKLSKNYQLGQLLDEFSVDEIEKTIFLLKQEIERLEAEKLEKSDKLSAAEELFQKK